MNKVLYNHKKWLGRLIFLACLLGQNIQPSWAEGSKQLIADGGDRPYLEWLDSNTYTTAGIPRQNKLKVYVETGETVYLGSSVYNAGTTPANQDIIYRSPFGGQNGACDVEDGGVGHINTLAKENLGPAPLASGGYTPCSFVATETGIYEVEFRSPKPLTNPTSGVNPPPISTSTQFATNDSQNGGIAAWDITVAKNGVAQTGRLFTNYIAMNLGGNSRSLNSKLYIQTKDGYRYETDMNGLDPFGFIFFANSRGFTDKTNNFTLYHSADSPSASLSPLNFYGNVGVQRPNVPDTSTDITHYVFFNRPAIATLVALGIPLSATPPAIPQNFIFTGGSGGSGNQTFIGVGGNFSFNVASGGSYQIIIDTNADGIFDPSVDRVLQNVMLAGSNVVFWNGKDTNGKDLLPRPGNQPYNAQITTKGGEYHFPLLDAENNPSGFRITMENPPAAFPSLIDQNGQSVGSSTIYYNNTEYTTANNTTVTLNPTGSQVPTSPRNASRGVNSSGGAHNFSNFYGDFKGMDTWIYFPSQVIFAPLIITTNKVANVRGTKSVRFLVDSDGGGTVNVGDIIEYTITYSNLTPGNSDAINFIITDNLPSQLTYQTATIVSATSGNNITLNSNYNGSGALTNSGTLRVGDTITMKITAKINNNNGGNPISNQATANFNTPDNSQASGKVITDADSAGATSNPPTVGNFFAQTADDGKDTGNDPSKTGDDDPTLFTVSTVTPNPPKLILVKRITRINNQNYTSFIDGRSDVPTSATNYVAAPRDTDDNDSKWPANYLLGAINAGAVKPGDDIEYTIYFLSSGSTNANNVKFCDLIPANLTFLTTAFNGLTPNDGGISGADQGMAMAVGSTTPTVYFSNVADSDRGTFYPANDPATPSFCGTNTNGAVLVNITRAAILSNLPPATGSGTPANSYGFVRFRAKVK